MKKSVAPPTEQERVDQLTDAEVLKEAGHGKFGPGLIGPILHKRAQEIMRGSAGGRFGAAITDPDYEEKRTAAKAAQREADKALDDETLLERYEKEALETGATEDEAYTMAKRRVRALRGEVTLKEVTGPASPTSGAIDPANLTDPRNPWTYVTLSGAKQLAQKHGVSYAPRVQRVALITALQEAGIIPPPVPDDQGGADGDEGPPPDLGGDRDAED